jgi:hypothetical protein
MDHARPEVTQAFPKREPIPQYFGPADVDRWGKVVTELVGEVWALSERVRRLEQSLASQGIPFTEAEDADDHLERRTRYLRRNLWPFFDDGEPGD